MAAEIVKASVADWAEVREIRLRALADAPQAFASRLVDEQDRPESLWRDRLSWADASTFLALIDGATVGLVTGIRDSDERARAHLVSMWVSPEQRRCGVATALTHAVLDCARLARVQVVDLWVTEGNDAARHLYEQCGFIESGEHQPLPSNPRLDEIGMHRFILDEFEGHP